MNRRGMFLTISLFFFVLVLVGCSNSNASISSSHSSDYPIASSVEDLTEDADLIVTGEYKELEETWNMARNPDNPEKESSENYREGHLYNFEVDEVIHGDQENEILVNIAYQRKETMDVDGQRKQVMIQDPYYVEPDQETSYMLFLKEDREFNNYYGAMKPFQVKMKENNQAELVSNALSNNAGEQEMEEIAETAEGQEVNVSTEVSEIEDFLQEETVEDLKRRVQETVGSSEGTQ